MVPAMEKLNHALVKEGTLKLEEYAQPLDLGDLAQLKVTATELPMVCVI